MPLYPISTALQNLNVSCEVRRFDDSYITIIYEGRVVGRTNGNSSSGSSKKNNNANVAGGKDPYLDGFVDPLAGYNQFNQFNIAPTSIVVIEYFGLPSDLIIEFNVVPIIENGNPIAIT